MFLVLFFCILWLVLQRRVLFSPSVYIKKLISFVQLVLVYAFDILITLFCFFIHLNCSRSIVFTWSRSSVVVPFMVGNTIAVHNGRDHVPGADARAPAAARAAAGGWNRGLCGGRDAVCRDAGPRAQPRRAAAGVVVSDHDSGDHCGRPGHRGAVRGRRGRADRPRVARHARVLRRRVHHAVALDVRGGHDGVIGT